MDFVFPTFVRASTDDVAATNAALEASNTPQKSLLDLVIEAGGELGLVPQRERAKRLRGWDAPAGDAGDDADNDNGVFGGRGAAHAEDGAVAVLSTRTAWIPPHYVLDHCFRRSFFQAFTDIHGLRFHALGPMDMTLPPPPLFHWRDLRLPHVLEASLLQRLQPRHGYGGHPGSGLASDPAGRRTGRGVERGRRQGRGGHPQGAFYPTPAPLTFEEVVKATQLRDLLECQASAALMGDGSLPSAPQRSTQGDEPAWLRPLQQVGLPSMLMGHHTMLCGPPQSGKSLAACLSLGLHALRAYTSDLAEEAAALATYKTRQKEEADTSQHDGSEDSRGRDEEPAEPSSSASLPRGVLLVPSFNELREWAGWLSEVFGPHAFRFYTLSQDGVDVTPYESDAQKQALERDAAQAEADEEARWRAQAEAEARAAQDAEASEKLASLINLIEVAAADLKPAVGADEETTAAESDEREAHRRTRSHGRSHHHRSHNDDDNERGERRHRERRRRRDRRSSRHHHHRRHRTRSRDSDSDSIESRSRSARSDDDSDESRRHHSRRRARDEKTRLSSTRLARHDSDRRRDDEDRDSHHHKSHRHRTRSPRARKHRRRDDETDAYDRETARSSSRRHHRGHTSDDGRPRRERDDDPESKCATGTESGEPGVLALPTTAVPNEETVPTAVPSPPADPPTPQTEHSWLPAYLRQGCPLLITTAVAFQRAVSANDGHCESLRLERVRSCVVLHLEKWLQPPLMENFPPTYWMRLCTAMDVDCQFLFTLRRSVRPALEFVRNTVLPDIGASAPLASTASARTDDDDAYEDLNAEEAVRDATRLIVWEQGDETVWELTQMDVQPVHVSAAPTGVGNEGPRVSMEEIDVAKAVRAAAMVIEFFMARADTQYGENDRDMAMHKSDQNADVKQTDALGATNTSTVRDSSGAAGAPPPPPVLSTHRYLQPPTATSTSAAEGDDPTMAPSIPTRLPASPFSDDAVRPSPTDVHHSDEHGSDGAPHGGRAPAPPLVPSAWQGPLVVIFTGSRREQQFVETQVSRLLRESNVDRRAALVRVGTSCESFTRGELEVLVVTDTQIQDGRDTRTLMLHTRQLPEMLVHFSLPRVAVHGSLEDMRECVATRHRGLLGHTHKALNQLRGREKVASWILMTEHHMNGKVGTKVMEMLTSVS